MFLVQILGKSILYTGDFSMTPDRHLGAAQPSFANPDLLISESTYELLCSRQSLCLLCSR